MRIRKKLVLLFSCIFLLINYVSVYADGLTKQTNTAYALGAGAYIRHTAYYYINDGWSYGVPVAYKASGSALQVSPNITNVVKDDAFNGGYLTISYNIAITDYGYNVGYAYPDPLTWTCMYAQIH